jgi:hypothetical protein
MKYYQYIYGLQYVYTCYWWTLHPHNLAWGNVAATVFITGFSKSRKTLLGRPAGRTREVKMSNTFLSEMGKVTLKINGDEALSNESL